ncbi:MAG: PAS domain S-box protein [Deltaproteobacteria bacterium]|nr:PAS domain S-box protein [Deltaproteobacteria bacterium]
MKLRNRMPLIRLRLKGKIILYGIMIIVVIATIFTSYFIITEKKAFENELKNRAASFVRNLAYNCEYPVLLEDIPAIRKLATGMINDEDVSFIDIQDTTGKKLLSIEKEIVPREGDVTVHHIQKGNDQTVFSERSGFLFVSFPVWTPVEEDLFQIAESTGTPEKRSIGEITVGFSLNRTNGLIYSSVKNTLFLTTVITVISILFLIIASNRLIQPLQMLVEGTREVTSGNFSHRVSVNRTDEMGELAVAFNSMTENLEDNKKFQDSYHQMLEGKILERTMELLEREEALKESERKYRTIFENTGTAMVIIEEDGILSLVNTEFEKLTGYLKEEVENKKNWMEFVVKDDLQKMNMYRALRKTNPNAAPKQYEFQIIHKNGQIKDLFINIDLIPGTKKSLASLIDITEQKKLAAQLLRAQKMEAMGTLAGGVAHDLNNVLGVLVGYSELLLLEIPEGNPLRRHVTHILQSSLRAAAIIQDLLTMARRGVAVSEVINMNDIISEYLKTPEFEKMMSFHKLVKVKTDCEENLLNIIGSPLHSSKSIMNLISNAAEAMPDGGVITVTTCNRYLDIPIKGYDTMEEGDYVVLSVSDTGKGISPQDISRIFEPFYTKKVMGRSGTGLGLAIVWGTVKDHGGYIDVQSEEGKGTTFSLYFPVTRKELPKVQPPVSVNEYMGRRETLLVVDDVQAQRELAVAMLNNLNYQVTSVSSGEEAVEHLKANKADLVLLDMIMDPGIDGLQTYKKIIEITSNQKAIIVSGFSETDRVKEAQKLGAGAYVRKPYIREKLGLAVRRELDK